jgi:hypothetical protein
MERAIDTVITRGFVDDVLVSNVSAPYEFSRYIAWTLRVLV